MQTDAALYLLKGILVGGSAGMNVCAAIKIAEAAPEGSVVVTILCDNGVKYVHVSDKQLTVHSIS